MPEYDPKSDEGADKQRELVLELGRRIEQSIFEFCRAKGTDLKTGVVSLGLKYVLDLITRRKNVASAYYLQSKKLADLAYDKVIEPFSKEDMKQQMTQEESEILTPKM